MKLNHRRSILTIQKNPDELHKLREALRISKTKLPINNKGYKYIAGYHGVPAWHCWHHIGSMRTSIRARLFLPWHRAYLHHLEINLRELTDDPSITIPYWDWRYPTQGKEVPEEYDKTSELPIAFTKPASGEDNPLYNCNIGHLNIPETPVTTRERNPRAIRPTENEINVILNNTNFSAFEYELEQQHDRIHGFVGGSMGRVGEAAYDPIFWAHHAMIDRIWYMWQTDEERPGNLTTGFERYLNAPLAPFNVTVGEVLDTANLGYEYAGDKKELSVKVRGTT